MALSLGIVGLPNSGKSTLFNALTKAGAAVASYPFTTIEPNVGVVPVPDRRLADVASVVHTERLIPATIEFVDIAGLVQGASQGEGLGNQFLGQIRNVDAVVVVLRCFANPDVPHLYGEIDPRRDALILGTELGLADLASVGRRLERARSAAKGGDKRALREVALFSRLHDHLNAGQPARSFALPAEDADFARELGLTTGLLTAKPVLYVANVGEEELGATIAQLAARRPEQPSLAALWDLAQAEGAALVAISARLEAELRELTPAEAQEYLASLGVTESGLERLIRAGYGLLNLITFFTITGGKEVRAWPVAQGTKAPQAAGKVHSDMERGFIRAEVIGCADLLAASSLAEAREHGLVRLEGRDYAVRDGDVVHFRFAL